MPVDGVLDGPEDVGRRGGALHVGKRSPDPLLLGLDVDPAHVVWGTLHDRHHLPQRGGGHVLEALAQLRLVGEPHPQLALVGVEVVGV